MTVMIWTGAGREVNELFRKLIAAARYPYVQRKLNNARWHAIESNTQATEYQNGMQFITVGEVVDSGDLT